MAPSRSPSSPRRAVALTARDAVRPLQPLLVDALDAEGRTPLERAESAGMREAADVLRRHAEIPRDHIASFSPGRGMVLGWGVHGWRGRWLVNGSSKGLVRLEIDPAVRARGDHDADTEGETASHTTPFAW